MRGVRPIAALALAACGSAGREAASGSSTDGGLRVVASAGALAAPDSVDAGWTRLRVDEDGAGHIVVVFRLADGTTLREWVASEGETGTDVAGMARLGAGRTAYLPVALPAGEYVAYCLIPDARTRQPHAMLGMVRALHVE